MILRVRFPLLLQNKKLKKLRKEVKKYLTLQVNQKNKNLLNRRIRLQDIKKLRKILKDQLRSRVILKLFREKRTTSENTL